MRTTIALALILGLAAGSVAQTTLLLEDFASASGDGAASAVAPLNWQIDVDLGNGSEGWDFSDVHGSVSGFFPLLGFSGPFALLDSDDGGVNNLVPEDCSLITPPVTLTAGAEASLSWDELIRGGGTGIACVDISIDGGMNWTTLFTHSVIGDLAQRNALDLSAFAGNTAQLRWRWQGNWAWWWAVDNVRIEEFPPPLYPGTEEDLILHTSIDFGAFDRNDVKAATPGQVVGLRLQSPDGRFLGQNFSILASVFNHSGGGTVPPVTIGPSVPGCPCTGLYAIPGVTFSAFGSGNILVLGVPALLDATGVRIFFAWPFAAVGMDVLFQGLIRSNLGVQNPFFASTRGMVIDG